MHGIKSLQDQDNHVKEIEIEVNGESYRAKLADNFITQSWGLSLKSEGKMLFDFGETRASIDMMLLSEPLYLCFMNSEKKVIDVQKAEPWTFDPRTWELYSPGRLYSYLLESFEDLGLEEGDEIRFEI